MPGGPGKRTVFVALAATIVLVVGSTSGVAAGHGPVGVQAPLAFKTSGTLTPRAYLPFLEGPFDCSQVTDVPLAECQALVAFYLSANGAYWSYQAGWLTGPSVCNWSWYGVDCNAGHA